MKTYSQIDGTDIFTEEELPNLIDKLADRPLEIIFASYRKIGLYPPGPVETYLSDLWVHVVNDMGSCDKINQTVIDCDSHNILLCIYCGPAEIRNTTKIAHQFRIKYPNAVIIGASCLCGLPYERDEDIFDYIVMHKNCGMKEELGLLLFSFIYTWKNKTIK